MNNLQRLREIGQSIWLDYIERSMIASGKLANLVETGIAGVTSNPSIFKKAIVGGEAYDKQIAELAAKGDSAEGIYEAIAIDDISRAADILRPAFDGSGGIDGYVSLEVSPLIAHDTEKTISEARRLFRILDRPNVMIKIPATPEGMPAIRKLIGEGINVNVTLIFSIEQFEDAAAAYIAGLEDLCAAGGDPSRVASVASIFVSRLDGKIDPILESMGIDDLRGKIAIANSKTIYARFEEIIAEKRWKALSKKGARVQRVLWASTSTKNPRYSDLLYVQNLIGPQTVNTLPTATLEAALDHLVVEETLLTDMDGARGSLDELSAHGIDLGEITEELLDEGVKKFADAFDALIESIKKRAATIGG